MVLYRTVWSVGTWRRIFVFTPGCSGRNLFLAKNYFAVVQPRIYTRCSYVNHDTYVLIGIKNRNVSISGDRIICEVVLLNTKYSWLYCPSLLHLYFLLDYRFWYISQKSDPPATPSRILDFRKLLSTLLHFWNYWQKNLRWHTSLEGSLWRLGATKYYQGFETAGNETATVFYQNLSKTAIVGGFLATAKTWLMCYDKKSLLGIMPEYV
jgi:hypothetical protein